MKNLILTRGSLVILVLAVVALVGIQAGIAYIIDDSTKVADGVICDVKDVGVSDNHVQMKLNCSDREVTTTQTTVIVSYMKNPGPLTCALYKTDNAKCKSRE